MTKNDVINDVVSYFNKNIGKFKFNINSIGNECINFSYEYNTIICLFGIYLINDERDKDNIIIKYLSNNEISNIKRFKTSSKTKYYKSRLFDKLNSIISELNQHYSCEKNKIADKEKYALELESYYNKIHNDITINIDKYNHKDIIEIRIIGYDIGKKTIYDIHFLDNKYYLERKEQTFFNNKNIKI